VALGIIGALAAVSVHMMVDFLSTYTSLTLLWLFAGLAAALRLMGHATLTSQFACDHA
jgi:hypothetical protein